MNGPSAAYLAARGLWAQPDVEQRVLAAVMIEPEKLRLAAELETHDFTDLRYREMFDALRNLQARGEAIGPCEIYDELVRRDRDRDKHVTDTITLSFVANVIAVDAYETTFYDAWFVVFEADLRQLRKIRLAREAV